jgi:diguanylate cyclase (GGDEF)-like protein
VRRVLVVDVTWAIVGVVSIVGALLLAVVWSTFRFTDLATCLTFLALASAAVVATRGPSVPGRMEERIRRGVLAQWTVPVVLLLPPVCAVAVHLPLCCLGRGLGRGPAPGLGSRRRRDDSAAAPAAQVPESLVGRPADSRVGFVVDAAVLSVAGFCASSTHLALAPGNGPYTVDSLVGSSERVGALFAAVAMYLVISRLLFAGVRRLGGPSGTMSLPMADRHLTDRHRNRKWPGARSDRESPALVRHESILVEAVAMCSAIVIAVLWTAHPLLVLAATPTALLLQRSVLHAELLQAARHDSKTGLANSAWWREVAEAEVVRARRTDRPLSVLLADIDHFKSVNDGHGHIVGDLVLACVADALRAATRPRQLVGRFGGEEFVVLLAEVDIEGAAHVAERLRTQVAEAECRRDGHPPLSVTLSVGVATASGADIDLSVLLERADAALYQAKAEGRNRIRVAS